MTVIPEFFNAERSAFFVPLTGKYREITANCIRSLYLRLNGPEADYSYNLNRKDILDIFVQCIREYPVILDAQSSEDEGDDSGVAPQRSEPAIDADATAINPARLARDTYTRLRRCGWLEEYMDPGMMETAVRFSASGRQFAQPFAQQRQEIITNTQHTRSTLSHLKTFIDRIETHKEISVSDLMIATKQAFEIIADFNDLIEALVEKRRELMASVNREIQEAKQAGESFFEFMEKRFMPDIRFRFSADSVERYRHEILDAVNKIRHLNKDAQIAAERDLRAAHPTLLTPDRPLLLSWALDQIEYHVCMACDIKLPELRAETENFVRRAQALITHIASISLGESDSESIFSIASRLAELNPVDLKAVFDNPKARFAQLDVSLYNPGKIQAPVMAKKEQMDSSFDEVVDMDADARRQAYIRSHLERTFAVDSTKISDYVIKQLAGGHRIKASQLPITDAASLLSAIHAPQLASVSGGERACFRIVNGDPVNNDFFQGDGFELEYIPPDVD